MEMLRAFSGALESHKKGMLGFCQDLIRIATENPPGNHYRECIGRIRFEMDRLGLRHEVVETPGYGDLPRFSLLGFQGEGERVLYFHGHYDVVPAQRRELFSPRVQEGRLYGRGATDMKAGLAVMIYAAYLLKETGTPLKGRVGLCLVGDEETGGRGGSEYLDRAGLLGRNGLAMLTPEPTSGAVWNASRGAVTLQITVRGRSAHVGLQHQGINAFEGMLQVAAALQVLKSEVEDRRTAYRIGPEAAARSILMLGGRVEGGTNFNAVPESCRFTVERRFNPEESLDDEKARLLTLLEECRSRGIDLQVEVLQEGEASGVAEDHPVARRLAG
ncbi:MAG TPA: M20/M25/M40 family metallo-hydrolase, partial [Candidatus Polarisedimenticolia bacterium]|nr:M20/M25/M40 family metallo-hydrolase [Candidatus Polarisedimenticolia bacterium]